MPRIARKILIQRLYHSGLLDSLAAQSRINTARKLLQKSDLPITQVAYESGFQSLSQFNRNFFKLEGRTPREFRKSTRPLHTQSRVI